MLVLKKQTMATCLVIFLFAVILFGLKNYSIIKVTPGTSDDEVKITINFILPMQQDSVTSKIKAVPEYPGTTIKSSARWIDSNTLLVKLTPKGKPKGQLIKYEITNIPTVFPLISKSVSGKVRPKIQVKLLTSSEIKDIPTGGPVTISFNTPVKPESVKESIIYPVPGEITPLQHTRNGKTFTDYSVWQYTPQKPLENGAKYRITIKPGICSLAGVVKNQEQEIVFTTAAKLKVTSTDPGDGDRNVPLYTTVEINTNQELSTASVKITNLNTNTAVPAETEIINKKINVRPAYAFSPGSSYQVAASAKSTQKEVLAKYRFNFSTVDIGDKYWVDVKLGEQHTVTVYKGREKIKHMLASGGRPDMPTPLGHFYTQDRGHAFWSYRFGEGATYWVRLMGHILVHSVPKDQHWETKKEEHAKLGLPASHGCIRLDEEDARWFFNNIPRGTLVIIHR